MTHGAIKRGVIILILISAVVSAVRIFIFTPCYIPAKGMENVLWQGDYILINRLSKQPRFGDVYVYREGKSCDWCVGRCIGVAGDTLLMNDSMVDVLASTRKFVDYKQFYRSQRSHNIYELSRVEAQTLQKQDSLLRFAAMHRPLNEYTFVLPRRGELIRIDSANCNIYAKLINQNEPYHASVHNRSLWVDGHHVISWIFRDDYYWMASNNVLSLKDSRTYGPVCGSSIVGHTVCVLLSRDLKSGKFYFRPDRFLKAIN